MLQKFTPEDAARIIAESKAILARPLSAREEREGFGGAARSDPPVDLDVVPIETLNQRHRRELTEQAARDELEREREQARERREQERREARANATHGALLAETNQRVDVLKAQLLDVTRYCSKLARELIKMQTENNKLQAQVSKLEAELAKLQTEARQLKAANREARVIDLPVRAVTQ